MSTQKKPDADKRHHEHNEDRSRPSDYVERSNDHKVFDVTNTRPAPINPHRERDSDKDTDR